MYSPKSMKASEFLDSQEILDTLEYARKNKDDYALIGEILCKAKECKGLSHREAAVLMECSSEEHCREIEELARQIKEKLYGKRIVMFAPLYLSNYCVNGCIYCPYHFKNKSIRRRKLSQEEVRAEVAALQDMGHKRLALEAGEDPENNPLEYILECIDTIYSVRHRNGAIRRVNVNIAAASEEDYRRLKGAGIGTYILFQETYDRERYCKLHPAGPKSDYDFHAEAMNRAMAAGIDDVGIGALFGLSSFRYDLAALLMHAEHLEEAFGAGPHTVSVPRIRAASGVDNSGFRRAVSDDEFARLVSVIRIAVPYTGMIVSTRESEECRARALALGVSQISGGSSTSVGGYAESGGAADCTEQFEVNDGRPLGDIVKWLLKLGYVPSFCTACYRQGRTGDRFMALVKSGQIANICQANSLITLKEFLEDYAGDDVKAMGEAVIGEQMMHIPSDKIRERAGDFLRRIKNGERDFRF